MYLKILIFPMFILSKLASRKSQDKYVVTDYTSGLEEASDLDSILTDATDYMTIPARSTGSDRSRPQRKGQETPARGQLVEKKSPKKPRANIPDDVSTEGSCAPTRRGRGGKKRRNSYDSITKDDGSSVRTKDSSKCAKVNLSKLLGSDSTETESYDDDDDGTGCEEISCGGGRVTVRTKPRRPPSDSEESSDEESTSGSEKCPDLCEYDPTKLPEEKPKKCDSDCHRQEWLGRQRERKQAEMDDYLLRKGFRYFDDMCKCSLRCIMSQMYVDPFVRNIAFSTVGFALGVKLCWELDGFYVIF